MYHFNKGKTTIEQARANVEAAKAGSFVSMGPELQEQWDQEEHDLECWAEEERMANEEWYDDCHFDDCGEDLTEAELDELDRTTDWDAYESDKRVRIAESNEY